jgi:NAD-dependent dihydropyrimidine dehydrogenase PreA subunit
MGKPHRTTIHQYKESKGCMDCKGSFPYYVLQFDHRPTETKLANVSHLMRFGKNEHAWAEIEKCDVVCANCHAIRTHERLMV